MNKLLCLVFACWVLVACGGESGVQNETDGRTGLPAYAELPELVAPTPAPPAPIDEAPSARPRYCAITLGSNNTGLTPDKPDHQYHPESFRPAYATLLDLDGARCWRLFVASTPAIDPAQNPVAAANVPRVNADLAEEWNAYEARHPDRNRLIRVDLRAAIGDWSADYYADLAHMSVPGYRDRAAAAWVLAIEGALELDAQTPRALEFVGDSHTFGLGPRGEPRADGWRRYVFAHFAGVLTSFGAYADGAYPENRHSGVPGITIEKALAMRPR